MSGVDAGLLLLRLALAAILAAHASQKLFGWFHGPGLAGAAAVFDKLGQRPARPLVIVAAGCEYLAAASTASGLAFPLGCAVAGGTLLVAAGSLTLVSREYWNTGGGGEYPSVLCAVWLCLGFTGPGRWSLDSAASLPWTTAGSAQRVLIGVAVLVVALVTAAPVLLRARRAIGGARA